MNTSLSSSSMQSAPPMETTSAPSTETTMAQVDAPALVEMSHDTPAANANAVTMSANRVANPLWIIAVGMGIFFGAMALLVATS